METATATTTADETDARPMPDDMAVMAEFASEELQDHRWEAAGRSFAYWYDGVPSFAEGEFDDWTSRDYRTTMVQCLHAGPTDTITDPDGTAWRLRATFQVSPERPCEMIGGVHGGEAACPFCGATYGNPHGHAYIGEGWVEAVYLADDEEA